MSAKESRQQHDRGIVFKIQIPESSLFPEDFEAGVET
jgi:hypothetical protein